MLVVVTVAILAQEMSSLPLPYYTRSILRDEALKELVTRSCDGIPYPLGICEPENS